MSVDNQVALSRMTRGMPGSLSKATRQAVPPFLQKLYEMVSDSATDSLIRWSDTGDSFFVLDHERVAHDVLPRWFKHNNFASFVRQLNMYGFHKIPHLQQGVLKAETETELWNFEHPNFHRGQPDLLCLITRKKQAPERSAEEQQQAEKDGTIPTFVAPGLNAGSLVDINSIVNGIAAIKRHQATISADLNDLKSSNQHLWQEAIAARERHQKQQDTINRILKFLAGVFGSATSVTPHKGSPTDNSPHPRKRQRLMIEGAQVPLKLDNLTPLEPLDGEDTPLVATIDPEDNERTPSNRFLDVTTPSENPRASPAPSTIDSVHSPEATTPVAQFLGQSVSNGQDELMGGIFPSTTQFSAPIFPTSNSAFEPSHFTPPPNPHGNSNAPVALTAASQNAQNQKVLQAIMNSPTQLQQLLNMLNLQQTLPTPTPFDLNTQPDMSNPYFSNQPQQVQQPPPSGPLLSMPNNPHAFVNPDAQTMSLLHNDDATNFNFEPFLANEAQLQKSYKDASDISAEVDAMQASLDSLIENLGLDPAEIAASVHESGEHAALEGNPVLSSVLNDNTETHSSSNSNTPTTLSNASSVPSTDLNTDGSINTANDQFQGSIPDFDFNAFINEFSKQQSADTSGAGFNTFSSEPLDFDLTNDPSTTSPQLSAFVDEVSNPSDTSSPTMNRAQFIEEPIVITSASTPTSVSKNTNASDKKGRKRKSDVDPASINERSTATAPKTKRKK